MKPLQTKYIVALGILVLVLIVWGYYGYREHAANLAHRDTREEGCRGKTVKSVEYNTLEKKCFETAISACEKPTFASLKSCEERNNIQKQ